MNEGMIIVRNEKGRRVVKTGLEGCDLRPLASGGGGDSWAGAVSSQGEKREDKNGVGREGGMSELRRRGSEQMRGTRHLSRLCSLKDLRLQDSSQPVNSSNLLLPSKKSAYQTR
ncbi:hypothetical protein EYF80_010403 [Liparis tanakae]|uniref:Uncharacterized protein n=1 Tax=Liparis tanakae TaxID=230148 RepID=A0A4Z2IMZ2_9TELE|nr:hypothetical protein EYF80_010403 [Liparis tanakae]